MDKGMVGTMGLLHSMGDNSTVSDDGLVAGLVSGGNSQEGRDGGESLQHEKQLVTNF